MNRSRLIVGLLIALVVGLFASVFVFHELRRAFSSQPAQTGQIVVADVALPLGTRLTSSNIRVIPWPSNDPVPGMLTKVEDGIDRAVITQVAQNEPILEAKLAPKGAGAGLPAAIPEGMRAVSVAVNDVVGDAGFVMPGTSVDVLVTGQIPGATQSGASTSTRTILENIRVLAAGQKIDKDADGKPETVPVVTLLVTPNDAAILTMASTEGKIQLALRNTIDVETPGPSPVLQATVFGSGAPPPVTQSAGRQVSVPKPHVMAPPAPYTVEIIVGDKREIKNFPNQ
jgi:pilus assembly protein CpaB